MKLQRSALLFFLAIASSCTSSRVIQIPTPPPVVDLARYAGCWYEIATIPMWSQKECTATTAVYEPINATSVSVANRCRWSSIDGEVREIKGTATVVAPPDNSRLTVQFDPWWGVFAKGHYWVLSLDEKYKYAVVGGPNPERLWILSRTPEMEAQVLATILDEVQEMGYDKSKIKITTQNAKSTRCGED